VPPFITFSTSLSVAIVVPPGVVIASAPCAAPVTEADCRRVNLGFIDPRRLTLEDYRADSETLVVEDAGRDLYLV
jgi:hypothetical protein